MDLFGIIFYIIIIAIFISAKKAAQSGHDHRGNSTKTRLSGNYSGQRKEMLNGNTNLSNVSKRMDQVIPNVPKTGRIAKPNVSESRRKTIPNVPEEGKTIIPNVPRKKKYEKIFMKPHKEERLQPKIRTNNLWGEDEHARQRIVALRLMEGDPVPEGYVKVKCPYCAAENLVTKNCKQYHSCYFCRVPID